MSYRCNIYIYIYIYIWTNPQMLCVSRYLSSVILNLCSVGIYGFKCLLCFATKQYEFVLLMPLFMNCEIIIMTLMYKSIVSYDISIIIPWQRSLGPPLTYESNPGLCFITRREHPAAPKSFREAVKSPMLCPWLCIWCMVRALTHWSRVRHMYASVI